MHWVNVLIMWAQVTSSSCSFHLLLRLHFFLRLPDTLEKGTTHCLRSTVWLVTFSFSSHSPPRWSWPMAIVATHWPFLWPQSCWSNGSYSPLALSYVRQVWIWSPQTGEEKEQDLSKEPWERLPPPKQIT